MAIFSTHKKESWSTKTFRWQMILFPSYASSGVRITFISDDWQEVHLKLPLNFWTRNYVGTIFGGSMYSAIDPVYMLQLIKILGKEYVVWDKSSTIQFKRPGTQTLYVRFLISEELIQEVKNKVLQHQETELTLPVQYVDKEGKVYVEITKTLYIANKDFYKEKRAKKKEANS
jgi:acyl-coenzyme A thioesterase PaaI-like protein